MLEIVEGFIKIIYYSVLMAENFKLQKSKISGAWLQNIRMDFLWKLCNGFALQHQYANWNSVLDRMWCELAGDIPPSHPFTRKILKYNESLAKIDLVLTNVYEEGFEKLSDTKKKKLEEIKKILMDKEIFLRRVTNKLGKGTKYVNKDEDDWE